MSLSVLRSTPSVTIALSLALVSGCSDAAEVESTLKARDLHDEEFDALMNEQGELKEALEDLNSRMEEAKSQHARLEDQLDGEAALLARMKSSVEGADEVEAAGGKR